MISNEVYNELTMFKTINKSFSEVLKELIDKNKLKKASNLRKCFGVLIKDKEWEEVKKDVGRGWKNWNKKYA